MTGPLAPGSLDPALTGYAARLIESTGTDLDAVLDALRTGGDSTHLPDALLAGWHQPDPPVRDHDLQEATDEP